MANQIVWTTESITTVTIAQGDTVNTVNPTGSAVNTVKINRPDESITPSSGS